MDEQMYLIMGCTASGKSSLAFELARRLGGEIISIDSMKVYRRMDIGTAKPSPEKLNALPHHLINVVEPWEYFGMGLYIDLVEPIIERLRKESRPIIASGGTAMYIRALMEGIFDGPPTNPELRARIEQEIAGLGSAAVHARLTAVDPQAAAKIHINDSKRITRALEVFELTGKPISSFQEQFRSGNLKYPWKMFWVVREKEAASRRINARVKKMVTDGLFDEVKTLLADERGLSQQAAQAVGYAEVIRHFNGVWTAEEAIERIKINTRQLAKHQRTWFRGFAGVNCLEVTDDDTAAGIAEKVLSSSSG